ncbi:hypothetical protein Bca101_031563 [Brassica carinata]
MKQKQIFNPQLDPARLLHQRRRCTSTVLDHRPLLLMMVLRNHHLVRKTLTRKDGSCSSMNMQRPWFWRLRKPLKR